MHVFLCVSSFVFFICDVLLFIANASSETLAEFLLQYIVCSSSASLSVFVCDNSQLVLCPDHSQTVLWDAWVSRDIITQSVLPLFKLYILCSNYPCNFFLVRKLVQKIVPFASTSGGNLLLLSMFHEFLCMSSNIFFNPPTSAGEEDEFSLPAEELSLPAMHHRSDVT